MRKRLDKVLKIATVSVLSLAQIAIGNSHITTNASPVEFGWGSGADSNYWYEQGTRQGVYGDSKNVWYDDVERGREIADPSNNQWYWLDAVRDGEKAVNKEVFMPYIYQDEANYRGDNDKVSEVASLSGQLNLRIETNGNYNTWNYFGNASGTMADQVYTAIILGKGKWVRYDSEGRMIKGWYTVQPGTYDAQLYPDQVGNTYYYDPQTGLMAKGVFTLINEYGEKAQYFFDENTGVLEEQLSNFRDESNVPMSEDGIYRVTVDGDGNKLDKSGKGQDYDIIIKHQYHSAEDLDITVEVVGQNVYYQRQGTSLDNATQNAYDSELPSGDLYIGSDFYHNVGLVSYGYPYYGRSKYQGHLEINIDPAWDYGDYTLIFKDKGKTFAEIKVVSRQEGAQYAQMDRFLEMLMEESGWYDDKSNYDKLRDFKITFADKYSYGYCKFEGTEFITTCYAECYIRYVAARYLGIPAKDIASFYASWNPNHRYAVIKVDGGWYTYELQGGGSHAVHLGKWSESGDENEITYLSIPK